MMRIIPGMALFPLRSKRRSKRYVGWDVKSEHGQQAMFFKMVRQTRHPAAEVTYAIPNGMGGTKTSTQKIYYWQEGVVAGVPDIHCAWPAVQGDGSRYASLYIELKVGKNSTTEKQDEMHQKLVSAGNLVYVCYGAKQAFGVWAQYVGLNG